MKALIIDLEPYREKAVNEARQARLDERMAQRCKHGRPADTYCWACAWEQEKPREIGGYPWRNISTDEALDHIRKEGLK